MARISLLFSLAFVLAIGSISAHPPTHKKTHNTLCPVTLSKLQTFPRVEILKLIEKKGQFEPTIQYKTLFAVILAYTDNLKGNVGFGSQSIHTKYALVTKAMLRAQAFVGVEGKLAVKLSKSYSAMAEGYVQLVDKMGEISAKYKFDADAKISQKDRTEIDNCLIKLKGSIRVYLKVISACTKKFSVGAKAGTHAGVKIGAKAGVKVGGLGGANVGAQGEAKVGGFFRQFLGFGGKVQYDAAGKANLSGGNGFRSLSHPHKKHLD